MDRGIGSWEGERVLTTCSLAMYYNGYILICIFLGVYIGGFIFQWETLSGGSHDS